MGSPGVQMLITEMMARWNIHLSYGAKKDVGDVRLTNGIIQCDAFSLLLSDFMIDPLTKILKTSLGERIEILYNIDDLKASTGSIEIAHNVHIIVKRYVAADGMVMNAKKSAIQLNVETPLPESLQDLPGMDERTYRYLGFEMKKGEVEREAMMRRIEEWIKKSMKNGQRGLMYSKQGIGLR